MKATGGAPAQPSPAGTPSVVTQASSDRAPGPQVDLEHAAPGPAEATIKEKLARMAVEFRGAIQDARRIAGFEHSGTLEEIDTLLEKLIPELDGSSRRILLKSLQALALTQLAKERGED